LIEPFLELEPLPFAASIKNQPGLIVLSEKGTNFGIPKWIDEESFNNVISALLACGVQLRSAPPLVGQFIEI